MSIFKYLPEVTVNFSTTRGTPVYTEDGLKIGKIYDYFVDYGEVYPQVMALQFREKGQFFYVKWSDVKFFSPKRVIVFNSYQIGRSRTFPVVSKTKSKKALLNFNEDRDTLEYPAIGKVILDRQVVDMEGKKVVRVNDIQFLKVGPVLRVVHASIGLRSMIRRLGYEKMIDLLVRFVRPQSKYLHVDPGINWKFVHAIPNKSVQENVQLSVTGQDFNEIHPADLADILEDLDEHARERIFKTLDPETAALTLSEVDQDMQAQLIKKDSPENIAQIIENMGTDEAADILNELGEETVGAIISEIKDEEIQDEIQELLEYEEDTAGGLMSTEVFQVSPSMKKSEVLKFIRDEHQDLESVYDIYAVDDEGKLIGTCSLKNLLIVEGDVSLGDVMETRDIKSMGPDEHWKTVASFMSKYNLINLPIVEKDDELIGMISIDDVLPWLLDEK